MIASTLDDREALDRARAAGGGLHLRADDARGQSALAACLARGDSDRAECLAEIEASLDSRGFYCVGVLHITEAGRTCGPVVLDSDRKVAILAAEAAARGRASSSPLPLLVAGAAAVALAWWCFR